jgi:hypothetical protein
MPSCWVVHRPDRVVDENLEVWHCVQVSSDRLLRHTCEEKKIRTIRLADEHEASYQLGFTGGS